MVICQQGHSTIHAEYKGLNFTKQSILNVQATIKEISNVSGIHRGNFAVKRAIPPNYRSSLRSGINSVKDNTQSIPD